MIRAIVVSTLLAGMSIPALADHRPGHHTPPGHLDRGSSSSDSVTVLLPGFGFSISDRQTAVAYYRNNPGALGSLSALPPGIARQVARGRGLPPGIARRAAPAGLVSLLSPVPDGFSLVVAGDRLVLLQISSDVIYDIIDLLGG